MVTVPIKKAGAYQLRVALRDQKSERVGSSSQFVDVPDMKKRRLELSGILLNATQSATTQTPTASDEAPQNNDADPTNSAAVRQFRRGQTMKYSFAIYNSHLDPTGQPKLQTQLKIFRDGQ